MSEVHLAYEAYLYDDDNGDPIYREVACGKWDNGHLALCDEHGAEAKERYPQGWQYYPGDVCVHGAYTGGSGIDWMCQYCEDGMTKWVDDASYRLMFTIGNSAPSEVPNMIRWMDSSIVDAWIQFGKFIMQPVWSTPEILALKPSWHVIRMETGYWDTP